VSSSGGGSITLWVNNFAKVDGSIPWIIMDRKLLGNKYYVSAYNAAVVYHVLRNLRAALSVL
jgi:hypothetical protein